jgi:hypothetical protein
MAFRQVPVVQIRDHAARRIMRRGLAKVARHPTCKLSSSVAK